MFHIAVDFLPLPDGWRAPVSRRRYQKFCRLLLSVKAGGLLCEGCDQKHINIALERRACLIYRCHAGLVDFLVPVYSEGEAIACFAGGQVLDSPPSAKRFKKIWPRVSGVGIPFHELQPAYLALPVIEWSRIKALVKMLELCARVIEETAFHLRRLPQTRSLAIVSEIKRFCAKQFANPLRLTEIAHHVHLDTSHVCRLFKRVTGTTIHQHLTTLRVEESKRPPNSALRTSKCSLWTRATKARPRIWLSSPSTTRLRSPIPSLDPQMAQLAAV